jgi:hypothetical protein
MHHRTSADGRAKYWTKSSNKNIGWVAENFPLAAAPSNSPETYYDPHLFPAFLLEVFYPLDSIDRNNKFYLPTKLTFNLSHYFYICFNLIFDCLELPFDRGL